jgi:hypothetical protein
VFTAKLISSSVNHVTYYSLKIAESYYKYQKHNSYIKVGVYIIWECTVHPCYTTGF